MNLDFSFNAELLIIHLVIYSFIIFIFLKIRRKIIDKRLVESVTSFDRGTESERGLILGLIKKGFPASSIFHDLYVKKSDGKFSQVDLVIATKQGIIVVEVKSASGWIYGSANQTNWTKTLAYGKIKHRFYNPIKQNINHIKALKETSKQFENIPFFSVIAFFGDCELKKIDYVPRDTYVTSAHRIFEALDIITKNNESAPYYDKFEVINILKNAVQNGDNDMIINKHKNDIQDMLGTNRILK